HPPPEQACAHQPQAGRARGLPEPRLIGCALRAPTDEVIHVLLPEHTYSPSGRCGFRADRAASASSWSVWILCSSRAATGSIRRSASGRDLRRTSRRPLDNGLVALAPAPARP